MQQLFIDTHTHYYPGFIFPGGVSTGRDSAPGEPQALVKYALDNMNRLAPTAIKVICFTDWGNAQGFESLQALASDLLPEDKKTAYQIHVQLLDERLLLVRRGGSEQTGPTNELAVLACVQLKSSEGLEVLGLGISRQMARKMFETEKNSSLPAQQLIDAINKAGGVAVIPWSFGKWWFKRGQVLRKLVSDGAIKSLGSIPFRATSEPLKLLVSLVGLAGICGELQELAGSDPLPVVGEGGLVGSFGSLITSSEIPMVAERLNSELILKLLGDSLVKKITLGARNSFLQAAKRYWCLQNFSRR